MTTTLQSPRAAEKPESRRPERAWLSVFGVVVALLIVVAGGYVAAGALSEPAGPPTSVSGVVQIQPLSGWSFAGRGRIAPSGPEFARLTRGGGSVDVVAYPGSGVTPSALAETYKRVLERDLTRLSVSSHLESVRTAAGLPGVRFSYSGVDPQTSITIDGEVTVIVGPGGNGAVFNGWAPAGLLSYASGDIDSMVNKAIVA